MYFIYILRLSNGNFYKGRTKNLDRRLLEHKSGKTPSIKEFLPFKLVHAEIVNNVSKAIELEKYFKSGIGREIIRELFN